MQSFNLQKMSVYNVLCFGVLLCVTKSMLGKQVIPIDGFRQCLISSPMSLGHCLGMGALTKLQSIDNNPEFDVVDGVSFTRDEQQVRESYNFIDRDPGDIRTIVDSVGQVFSRRSLRWDMSYLFPGLVMRVAPSISPGGVLEFVMDPHQEALSQHTLKEASTGRLIARQFVLPFLMGFKFNVATLIPIIFGLLAVMLKKAIFLSKVGLIISSAIGLGSLLFGSKFPPAGSYGQGAGGHYGGNYGGGGYGHHPYRIPVEEPYYGESIFRGDTAHNVETNAGLFNDIQQPLLREEKTGRNFAWNDAEKEIKS